MRNYFSPVLRKDIHNVREIELFLLLVHLYFTDIFFQVGHAENPQRLAGGSPSRAISIVDVHVGHRQAFDNVRRSDLLALARVTDQELRRTRWQVSNALAYARPDSGVPADAIDPVLEQEGGVQ